MLSRAEVEAIVTKLCGEIAHIFPQDKIDAILFGSYARGDAEFGSDIDLDRILTCFSSWIPPVRRLPKRIGR